MLQQVISRKEAKERGLKRHHGHCLKHGFVERYTSDNKCFVCNQEQTQNRRPEYIVWNGMIQRCTRPEHPSFPYYGGRGIEIYRPWRESFACFFQHVGERPSPKHSLDRKNNEYGYFPGNVRWVTAKEQANNKRKPQKRSKKSEQILPIAA
jgi:hypothetical protein